MPEIISVSNLQKSFQLVQRRAGFGGAVGNLFAPRYREVQAVDGISFSVQPGELVGYLGPNGAGKSTTIKILTGLLVPSGGDVRVDGCVPWKNRTQYVGRIGAVFGQRMTLWWDLPVLDSLELQQALYDIPLERYKQNLAEFRKLLEMDEFLYSPVRSLSLGQRMRAELCAALLHQPRLLFLDEPTIGLDVVAKERIRQFILHVNQRYQTTILLTTHDLSDVERLCERVMILDHGHLLYDGLLSALIERFESHRLLVVTFAQGYADVSLPGLGQPERVDTQAIYKFDPHRHPVAEVIQALQARYQIADLEVRRPDIEDTIRRIYEEKLLTPSGTFPANG